MEDNRDKEKVCALCGRPIGQSQSGITLWNGERIHMDCIIKRRPGGIEG